MTPPSPTWIGGVNLPNKETMAINLSKSKRKNINSTIPDGAYKRPPSNRVHVDKTKYLRKVKHK
jgi:hypothetical protein